MATIETLAWIIIGVAAIKMIVLLVKPTAWMKFVKGLYKRPKLAQFVALVLAAVVLYYLLGAGMTIVQILAATVFVALLLVMGLANEVDYFIKKYQALIKKGALWKQYWLYTLIWIIILVWGALVLLEII